MPRLQKSTPPLSIRRRKKIWWRNQKQLLQPLLHLVRSETSSNPDMDWLMFSTRNLVYSVEFFNFSATLILCEINWDNFRATVNVIGFEIWLLRDRTKKMAQNHQIKKQSLQKYVKKAVFRTQKSEKLISRKIWVAENLCK